MAASPVCGAPAAARTRSKTTHAALKDSLPLSRPGVSSSLHSTKCRMLTYKDMESPALHRIFDSSSEVAENAS
eukprot:1412446-Pyramimonas_sp.AAC.1